MRTDTLEKGDFKRGMFWQAFYVILELGYPALILLTIGRKPLLLGRYGGCELCGRENLHFFFVGLVAYHRKEALPFRCRHSVPRRALAKAEYLASYPATLGAQPSKF